MRLLQVRLLRTPLFDAPLTGACGPFQHYPISDVHTILIKAKDLQDDS